MKQQCGRWCVLAVFILALSIPHLGCWFHWINDGFGLPIIVMTLGIIQLEGDEKSTVTGQQEWSYLGAAAHLAGAEDTNWRTDVELHNASNTAATVTVELLDHGADNSAPASAEFFVGPRRSLRLSDVLATYFGDVDKAALRLSTTGGAIMATDRTYNLLGEGNALGLPAGSTFGQYISLRDTGAAVSDVDEGRLIGLTHDHRAQTDRMHPAPSQQNSNCQKARPK